MFVQLSKDDCTYLLDLINTMDSTTLFTAKQRIYTVPKLVAIAKDPRSARLAYQDVDYLLDLIEDDEQACISCPQETEQTRAMAQAQLLEIQALQKRKFEETKDIESQRAQRRAKRNGARGEPAHTLAEQLAAKA
jgi:hypothetical protein